MGRRVTAVEGEVVSGSELLIMPLTSFLTRCRRSPEIWRLTGAAYLVISHGAIKRRTASISAADCFAPVVLLYASLLWFRRISGIPTDRELQRTSYLAGSPNGSVYRSSRKSCILSTPPQRIISLGPADIVLWISSQSWRILSLADTDAPSPSLAFMVARSSFLSLNKIIKTFFVPECSLHVGQVGNQTMTGVCWVFRRKNKGGDE
ncbi:hypothetical protein ILYODFUR_006600 [Ilyodon furcidens]|uniref:Uncharacterized protein n=1 Tax=Ilyodon furcidens TaxID=33524 RepID=A0ABV0TSY8_9TELE